MTLRRAALVTATLLVASAVVVVPVGVETRDRSLEDLETTTLLAFGD